MSRWVAGAAALALMTGAVVGLAGGGDAVSAATAEVLPYDFDGDGYVDLTLGVWNEEVDRGEVHVLYGSSAGPTDRDQVLSRQGSSFASDDFDGDGYADLAIGNSTTQLGAAWWVGSVEVVYGGQGGLTTRDQVWHQDVPGVPGVNEHGDQFGSSLAAGDFDADGYADLAVGVRGTVVVLQGSASGLTSVGAQRFGQDAAGAPDPAAGGLGGQLAAADVTGDGRDDLVVGAGADLGYGEGSPVISLLKGSSAGLTMSGSQFIDGEGELGLRYRGGGGAALGDLTLADFNGDGQADLALTAQENWVALLHGHADGFHPARLTRPEKPGVDGVWSIPGWAEDADGEVAAGDLTGDGHPELVVRVDDPMMVFTGSSSGLTGSIIQWPVYGGGARVLALSGPGPAWLVTSVGDNSLPKGAGAVQIVQGRSDGGPGPSIILSQDSLGIEATAE